MPSVPENISLKAEECLGEGTLVFTFARLNQRQKLSSVENRIIASYVDTPEVFPDGAYVPVPEIVAMALGKYLRICDPSNMSMDILNKINIAEIAREDSILIFRLLPKPLRIDTNEESVRRYALLKRFLSAV